MSKVKDIKKIIKSQKKLKGKVKNSQIKSREKFQKFN